MQIVPKSELGEKPLRRFRIVHFIHLDGDGGGPYTVSKHITFYSHFHHVHIVHGGRGRISETCEELGIPHTRIESATLLDTLLSFPILVGIILNLKPDLFVIHGQWAGPIGALAGRLACVRRILYVAHWPSYFTDWNLFLVVRNWVAEWLPCRLAHRTILISRANWVTYHQMFPWLKGKVSLLSNSVDEGELPTERDILEVRRRHRWQPDRVHIVSVGRLVDQKRVDWLLDAWAGCRDLWSEATLWIVGDGPERAALEKVALAHGFGDSCHFLGSQPKGIVYIAAADITVFTSLYESFGNVTLEAMICGKPIIASRVPGIESTLEDRKQGFLVAPGDKTEMASKLRQLVRNATLRREMGESGKRRVRHFLTLLVLPRFLQIVNELLK